MVCFVIECSRHASQYLGVGRFKTSTIWNQTTGTSTIDSNIKSGFVYVLENSSGAYAVYVIGYNSVVFLTGNEERFKPITKVDDENFKFTVNGYSNGHVYTLSIT